MSGGLSHRRFRRSSVGVSAAWEVRDLVAPRQAGDGALEPVPAQLDAMGVELRRRRGRGRGGGRSRGRAEERSRPGWRSEVKEVLGNGGRDPGWCRSGLQMTPRSSA